MVELIVIPAAAFVGSNLDSVQSFLGESNNA